MKRHTGTMSTDIQMAKRERLSQGGLRKSATVGRSIRPSKVERLAMHQAELSAGELEKSLLEEQPTSQYLTCSRKRSQCLQTHRKLAHLNNRKSPSSRYGSADAPVYVVRSLWAFHKVFFIKFFSAKWTRPVCKLCNRLFREFRLSSKNSIEDLLSKFEAQIQWNSWASRGFWCWKLENKVKSFQWTFPMKSQNFLSSTQ